MPEEKRYWGGAYCQNIKSCWRGMIDEQKELDGGAETTLETMNMKSESQISFPEENVSIWQLNENTMTSFDVQEH